VHGEHSEPEPDVSVVRGRMEDFADEHPSTAVLVVEVSRSTLTYDLAAKSQLYASMGVPDYWVLDLDHRRLYIHREPTANAAAYFGHAYRSIVPLDESEGISPLEKPGTLIRVADLLPPKT
jgi:Uma2 family endonuclease